MALVTEREACVAGVESYSGPQGTLASPESLRSVPWHSRHSLEPLGTMYWTLIMCWAQFWLFTHIFGFDSWNPWGGYCPCWLNKSECFDNKSQSWALCPVFLGPIPSASLEGRRERRSSLYHRQGRVAEGKADPSPHPPSEIKGSRSPRKVVLSYQAPQLPYVLLIPSWFIFVQAWATQAKVVGIRTFKTTDSYQRLAVTQVPGPVVHEHVGSTHWPWVR